MTAFESLPAELALEIFSLCIPQYPECVHSAITSPARLTQICRHWRDIVLSGPSLWRAIRLRFRNVTPIVISKQIAKLHAFLARSGSCPIVIHLEGNQGFAESNKLLEAVMQYSSRWEYLSLDVDRDILEHILAAAPFPALRSLELLGKGSTMDDLPRIDLSSETAPLLRAISFCDISCTSATSLPWTNLTTLNLVHKTARECVQLLAFATSVVSARFSLRRGVGPTQLGNPEPVPHIVHPNLRTLVLDTLYFWVSEVPPEDVFSMMTLPRLRRLQVFDSILDRTYPGAPDPDSGVQRIVRFLARSECELEELRLQSHSSRLTIPLEEYTETFAGTTVRHVAQMEGYTFGWMGWS
ncbi:hypothetical protein MKEN_00181400 [Mycena kentingensis (nom. inval.)]|nr:hypothetical protein MKEN_00181400 [Mycena kentingensis (nom. inval.)]